MNREKRAQPHYIGHRERLKEKYRAAGLDGWREHEILEFALSYALPRKDVKPLAKELLARFKSFAGVLDAGIEELSAVNGLRMHSALFLKLLRDSGRLYLKKATAAQDLVASPAAAVDYLRSLLKGSADEEVYVLFLNAANRLIASERLHAGTVTRSAVYPRKVVERALFHHAVGAIVAHNHPGGSLQPSVDDRTATEALRKALDTVEISLLDHLIVTANGHYSWKEHGLL